MDSSLRRDVHLSTQMHSPFLLLLISLHHFLPTPCPWLGALADVLRASVACSASVLVSAERERLRGTAGWVQRLEGSLLLAKTPVPTAKALHLFIL